MKTETPFTVGDKVKIVSVPEIAYGYLYDRYIGKTGHIIRIYQHGERPILVRPFGYGKLLYLTKDNIELVKD